jgi:transmembrane sensor
MTGCVSLYKCLFDFILDFAFMTEEEYITLYQKSQSGKCSPEEMQLLMDYQDEYSFLVHKWHPAMGDQKRIEKNIYNRLQVSIDTNGAKTNFRGWLYAVAASVILVPLISIIWYNSTVTNQPILMTKAKKYHQSLNPENKAVLTLADGSRISLDDSTERIITKQNGAVIRSLGRGQLSYLPSGETGDKKLAYNTATTLNGGQCQFVLADGTKVWLNAVSSLTFPVVFKGKERRVVLTGEAYFEVAKSKSMPFIVIAGGQEVKVLGTHFNVNAYTDESAVKTTLIEGSVHVGSLHANYAALLKPGQQSTFNRQGISVNTINVNDAIAWKNGDFRLNEDIESIMKKISRWYNVDVVYQVKKDPNIKFGGSISKSKDLNAVLKMIEATGNVHFKVEGRKVYIME